MRAYGSPLGLILVLERVVNRDQQSLLYGLPTQRIIQKAGAGPNELLLMLKQGEVLQELVTLGRRQLIWIERMQVLDRQGQDILQFLCFTERVVEVAQGAQAVTMEAKAD
jgi:hypothetical protein